MLSSRKHMKGEYFPTHFLNNQYAMFFIISNSLIFGCAGSSLLHNLFSNCKGHGLLSGYSVRAANCSGFSCRDRLQSTQASVAAASGLSSTGSVVAQYELSCPWHMGSSQTKDWTHVSCTGRQMLYHWATREAPNSIFETNFILMPKPDKDNTRKRKLQVSIPQHRYRNPRQNVS